MAYETECPGCNRGLRLPLTAVDRVTHCPQCDCHFVPTARGNFEVVRGECDFCSETMWRRAAKTDQPSICHACRDSIEENDQGLREEALAAQQQQVGCLWTIVIGAALAGLIMLALWLKLESQ